MQTARWIESVIWCASLSVLKLAWLCFSAGIVRVGTPKCVKRAGYKPEELATFGKINIGNLRSHPSPPEGTLLTSLVPEQRTHLAQPQDTLPRRSVCD